MKKQNKMGRIDVQHHMCPKIYTDELKEIGITRAYGEKFIDWTPERSLKFMNKLNIGVAILSVSTPGVYFKGKKDFSMRLARSCNETMADVKKKYPERFGGFASVPLGFVGESIDELKYALDELKLDGVCLMTNYDGVYLGDKKYDNFFKELDKRRAVAFVHPTDPIETYHSHLGRMSAPLIEALFEDSRVIARMLYYNIFEKYPNIKFIFAHGAGVAPYISEKLEAVKYRKEKEMIPDIEKIQDFSLEEKGLDILNNLTFDITSLANDSCLNAIKSLSGISNLVYGSDFHYGEKINPITIKSVEKNPNLSKEDLEKIYYKNALEIFPQFKK